MVRIFPNVDAPLIPIVLVQAGLDPLKRLEVAARIEPAEDPAGSEQCAASEMMLISASPGCRCDAVETSGRR